MKFDEEKDRSTVQPSLSAKGLVEKIDRLIGWPPYTDGIERSDGLAFDHDEAARIIDQAIEDAANPWNVKVEELVFALEEAIKFGLIKPEADFNTGCADDTPYLAAYLQQREETMALLTKEEKSDENDS